MILSQASCILFHLVFIMSLQKGAVELITNFSEKQFLILHANLLLKCTAVPDCLPGLLSDVLLVLKRSPFCLSGQKEPLNSLMLQILWCLSHSTNTESEPTTPGAQWRVCGHQHEPWKPHLNICQHLGHKPPVLIQFSWTGQSQNCPMALSPSTMWSTKRDRMIQHLTSLLCMLSPWW